MSDRHRQIVAVHLFLFRDDHVLLARRCNTGWSDGLYSVPAGHVEKGETVRQAMVREATEEVGIRLKEKDLQVIHVMHRMSEAERVDFFLTAATWKGEPKLNEPDKCDDLGWFSVNKLPKNTIPYIKSALQNVHQDVFFSELGWK